MSASPHLGRYFLERMRRRNPNEICMIDAGTGREETVSYILKKSVQVARCFKRLGFEPGDVLCLAGVNHVDLRAPYYAALMTGLPVAGVDPLFKYHEIKWFLDLTKTKIVFCEQESYETYKKAAVDLGIDVKIVTFDGEETSLRRFIEEYDSGDPIDDFEATDFDTNAVYAWLVSTSGSTGLPKLAAFSHRHLLHITKQWMKAQLVNEQNAAKKRVLILSPTQWISGFSNSIGTLVIGSCIVQTSKGADTEHLIDIINKYKPTAMISSPGPHALILKHGKECNYESFDMVGLGGTTVHSNVVSGLKSKMRKDALVRELYGQTEAGTILFASNADSPQGSCGPLFDHMYTIKLVDPSTESEITEPFKTGELRFKGPRFECYYENPEETSCAIDNGWLKTGDLMYHDEQGNYFFVERLKMMIKFRNYAIVPPELEEVILTHPGVKLVAVTRVPHDTDGQHPVACVVRVPGATVTAQEIKDLVASQLSSSKQLRGGVIFMEDLPRTSTGKISRNVLEEIALKARRE